MQWHSVGEFLAMGGYAVYVWGSFGLCAVAMIVEPLLLRRRQREIVDALQRRERADGSTANWAAARWEATR